MEDGIAALCCAFDGRFVGDVADDDVRVREPDVEGIEDAANLPSVANEEPNGMAGRQEASNRVGARKAGSAGDHHAHRQSTASPEPLWAQSLGAFSVELVMACSRIETFG
jgi:hypothetical protein